MECCSFNLKLNIFWWCQMRLSNSYIMAQDLLDFIGFLLTICKFLHAKLSNFRKVWFVSFNIGLLIQLRPFYVRLSRRYYRDKIYCWTKNFVKRLQSGKPHEIKDKKYILLFLIMVQYSWLESWEVQCCVIKKKLLCMALHYTTLHCTALHCTAVHCTSLHCTELHCSALHCNALHSTAL